MWIVFFVPTESPAAGATAPLSAAGQFSDPVKRFSEIVTEARMDGCTFTETKQLCVPIKPCFTMTIPAMW